MQSAIALSFRSTFLPRHPVPYLFRQGSWPGLAAGADALHTPRLPLSPVPSLVLARELPDSIPHHGQTMSCRLTAQLAHLTGTGLPAQLGEVHGCRECQPPFHH